MPFRGSKCNSVFVKRKRMWKNYCSYGKLYSVYYADEYCTSGFSYYYISLYHKNEGAYFFFSTEDPEAYEKKSIRCIKTNNCNTSCNFINYLKEDLFLEIKIINGNLNWNDYDLNFTILNLL